MADGGAICLSGHLMTILAAREHAVPVVGVTGVYKLTPLFAHNQTHVLNVMNSPCTTLAYSSPVNSDNVEVSVPIFDYISPDNIELFVTNNGSHQPSYVYRLLSEFFHQDDYEI
jgi:translation initiation factor eIF-2B subunit beta